MLCILVSSECPLSCCVRPQKKTIKNISNIHARTTITWVSQRRNRTCSKCGTSIAGPSSVATAARWWRDGEAVLTITRDRLPLTTCHLLHHSITPSTTSTTTTSTKPHHPHIQLLPSCWPPSGCHTLHQVKKNHLCAFSFY